MSTAAKRKGGKGGTRGGPREQQKKVTPWVAASVAIGVLASVTVAAYFVTLSSKAALPVHQVPTHQQNVSSIQRPPAEPLTKFSDWAWDRKVRMDGMIPRWRPGFGWGLFARRQLTDMKLLAVPPWAMLSEDDIIGRAPPEGGKVWQRSALVEAAEKAELGDDSFATFCLVLRLLTLAKPPDGDESARRGAEFWAPYIGVLPSPQTGAAFEIPVFLSDEGAAACLPQEMQDRRAVRLAEVDGILKAATSSILWGDDEPTFGEEEVRWAYGVVLTRAMTIPASPVTNGLSKAVMVPAGDIFNQDHVGPNALWSLNATHGFVAWVDGDMIVEKGEQVFIDYKSVYSTAQIVEQYGYAPAVPHHLLHTQTGLQVEGELKAIADKKCVPGSLWLRVDTGELSGELVACVVYGLLSQRPEGWLYAQGKLPPIMQLSMNISAYHHQLRVLQHQKLHHVAGGGCASLGKVGEAVMAASESMKRTIDGAAVMVRKRAEAMEAEFEAHPSRSNIQTLYHRPSGKQ
eukprot:Hpha_TRINITY_DN9847_c0_g1::TRINITY_DN9847_c0_g1_i1::g.81326::m.81326